MEPIPDAVAWAVRADAWSQRPSAAVEPSTELQESTNRWSDVATTGRPAFPPDGVGWRSATSEWRSTTESRWRQTTEWRSRSGTSGWRSTTEAWQSGDNADQIRPPVEPLTRLPAISGTAWPTPQGDEQPWSATPDVTPGRPPPDAASSARAPADSTSTWQTPSTDPAATATPAPPWQTPPADPTGSTAAAPPWLTLPPEPTPPPGLSPPWQSGPAEPAPAWRSTDSRPSWQQAAESTPSWQTPADSTPSWRKPAPDTAASLQSPVDSTWRSGADNTPSWQSSDPAPVWQPSSSTPSWQQPVDNTPSWQQPVDNTPSWQQPVDGTPSWQQPQSRPGWQAPADEPAPSWRSSRTGEPAASWRTPVEPTSSWQAAPETGPAWQHPESRSSWRTSPQPTSGERGREAGGWSPATAPASGPYGGAWSGPAYDDGRHLVREDDRAQWRRESAAGMHGVQEAPRRVGRRRAPDADVAQPGGGTGWAGRPDADNWAGHTDTGNIPVFRDDERDGSGWRRESGRAEPDAWRARQSARQERGADWDSGVASRDDDARGRRQPRRDTPRPEAGSGRRRLRESPASDPWARDAADTSVGPLAWQDPENTGTGGWRSPSDTGTWRRYADDPEDAVGPARPGSGAATWRSAPERGAPRRPGPEDDDPRARPARRRAEIEDDDLRARPPRRRAEVEDQRRPYPEDDERARRRAPDPVDDDEEWLDDDQDDPPPPRSWRPGQDDDRTQSWRRELQEDLQVESGPGRGDATEIRRGREPGDWRREERAASRGNASYREGNTDDWRQQLAAQGPGARGEGRGAGSADFPRFRPPGSATPDDDAPTAVAAAPAVGPVLGEARQREELLVGSRPGGGASWQDPPDTQWPPRRAMDAATGRGSLALADPYERRPVSMLTDTTGRQRSLLEPDDEELEDDPGGPLAAAGFTVVWYSVPVVLFVLYMLVLDGAQQAQALRTLAGAAPQFGLSMVLSLAVAVGLRWLSGTWKAASVGLAAAVLGGGLATVLNSAITGQSLS